MKWNSDGSIGAEQAFESVEESSEIEAIAALCPIAKEKSTKSGNAALAAGVIGTKASKAGGGHYYRYVRPTYSTQVEYTAYQLAYRIKAGDGAIRMAAAFNEYIKKKNMKMKQIRAEDVVDQNPNIFHAFLINGAYDGKQYYWPDPRHDNLPAGPEDDVKFAYIFILKEKRTKYQVIKNDIKYIPFGVGGQQYGAYLDITANGGIKGSVKFILGAPGVAGLYAGIEGKITSKKVFKYSSKTGKVTWPKSPQGEYLDFSISFIYGFDWLLGEIGGETIIYDSKKGTQTGDTELNYSFSPSHLNPAKSVKELENDNNKRKSTKPTGGVTFTPKYEVIKGFKIDTIKVSVDVNGAGGVTAEFPISPGVFVESYIGVFGSAKFELSVFKVDDVTKNKTLKFIERQYTYKIVPKEIGKFRRKVGTQNKSTKVYLETDFNLPAEVQRYKAIPIN